MKNYNQEVENLLTAGRNMSEVDFDNYLDSYLGKKSDSEKEKIGEEVLKVKLSRFNKIKKINNKVSFLIQMEGVEI